MSATLYGFWRDLKCVDCDTITGFTRADLDEVMDKDYRKRYWCEKCDQHTDQVFAGSNYELVNSERIYNQLPYED